MAATSGPQRDRVAAVSEKIPRANTAQAAKTSVGVYDKDIYIYMLSSFVKST